MQQLLYPSIFFLIFFIHTTAYAQCPTALGDEVSYGNNNWIGYVYDGANNFNSANYQGFITQAAIFDESFCGNNCNFTTNGCAVQTETFSVRYRMQANFACGLYEFVIGGDDGIRLSIDGGATYIIDDYSYHPYQTSSVTVFLNGSYNLVLEYFEGSGENRVSFNYSFLGGTEDPGLIAGQQDFCSANAVDPNILSSLNPAQSCIGTPPIYQWQSSLDNISFGDIPGANTASYDPPATLTQTTYYRRQVDFGGTILHSNVVTINKTAPLGDELSYGMNSWIGYVYDGANNYNTNDYQGFVTESEIFDQSFCGNNCFLNTNGCAVQTESFTVRYRMRKNFNCGIYELTIGGDDGVRLSINGGATYIIDDYSNHGYRTSATTIALDGTYDLVLEYYEQGGGNRVSFNYSLIDTEDAGTITGDQNFCSASNIDPGPLNNSSLAYSCAAGAISYQWQASLDNISFSDIPGANTPSYDPPLGPAQTTYYRRQADLGGNILYSNTVTVSSTSPQGDELSYGNNSWIGYVYDGADNFNSADYQGFITETEIFDESFCGNNCLQSTNGCAVQTESFTVRFKMRKNFPPGDYEIVIGGDDGVRLSLDGGNTYVLDDYTLHGYRTTTGTFTLSGNVDLVLEYYEQGSDNRVTFNYTLVNPLPVELSSFSAVADAKEGVLLRWRTASELNNDYFDIERSRNGYQWEYLVQIQGAGTSSTPQDYEYHDASASFGQYYYRLKQVDFDGSLEYSPIRTVQLQQTTTEQVYPNPGKDQIILKGYFSAKDHLLIWNMLGQNVGHQVQVIEQTNQRLRLQISNLSSGSYFIKVGNSNYRITKQ